MKNKRKRNLGYIKEEELFFNDDLNIDKNNIIDVDDINNDFVYNQPQEINIIEQEQTQEEFDYTFLKIIIFLIFV